MEHQIAIAEVRSGIAELRGSLHALLGELAGMREEIDRATGTRTEPSPGTAPTAAAAGSGLIPVVRIVQRPQTVPARKALPAPPRANPAPRPLPMSAHVEVPDLAAR